MRITELEITDKTAIKLGLNAAEFEKIKDVLGRTPNFVELNIYAVMWSERCSYKNSIKWLKTLPRESNRILVGAGYENTGLLDIGDGIACAFEIKSQNYSSDSEPYDGASKVFGGTHLGIFSMGARPIAVLNSLRFGFSDNVHRKGLLKSMVKGMGAYGNSLGIQMLAGEVFFDDCYNQNILVDAILGIVRVGETVSAVADGLRNPVFIVGSRSDNDGIHVETFASADFLNESHEDLPTVQVGDHLNGKLLLEACLEAIKTGAVSGMQDIGVEGIICPSSEMSAKSKTGMRIDLNKLSTRQTNMHACEILFSEGQKGMLIIGHAGQEQVLYDVFEKWGLDCVQIGEVTNTGMLEYYYEGEKVAEIPANSLVRGSGAPVYDREYTKPAYLSEVSKFRLNKIEPTKDFKAAAKRLFSLPNLVFKRWVYGHYNSTEHTTKISTNAPSDAAVVPIESSQKSLIVAVGCNPAYVHADPYAGAMIAIAEAARNIACTGGELVAVTISLNFGNLYNPEDYYQFVNVIKGMGEACRKFNIPVAGCNVSLNNQNQVENKTETMFSTPTIGMLGIMEDPSLQMTTRFKKEGDVIYMLGNIQNDLGSSEYLRNVLGVNYSPAPAFDLHEEHAIQQLIRQLLRRKWLSSVHSVSSGGLFTNLLESAIASGLGFNIETMDTFRKDCFLFGESQSRVVVTTSLEREDEFQNYLVSQNVSFTKLGEVFGTDVVIDDENFGSVGEWKANFDNTFGELFG